MTLPFASQDARAGEEDKEETRPVEDPMQPTWLRNRNSESQQQDPRRRFKVDTILVSPERRIAIINGSGVKVGDWIHGARVVRIDPESVTLEMRGARLTIALAVSDIKRAPGNGR